MFMGVHGGRWGRGILASFDAFLNFGCFAAKWCRLKGDWVCVMPFRKGG